MSSPLPADETARRRQLVRAVVASTIGTTIEWYDFFLYGSMAALVFPKLFFTNTDRGLLESFTTIAVGFVSRPVGAAIFGHFGDRLGRKSTLIVTLLLMGVATFLIGLLPTQATLGPWAAVILMVLRFCQGLGVGGEWGGSVLMSMEWHRGGRRGFIASWPQVGVPLGLALSLGATSFFNFLLPHTFLETGWRYPFLVSALLLLVGLFIRLSVLETPAFARVTEQRNVPRAPVLEVIRHQWLDIILAALVRMAEQAPFYIFTVWVLSYVSKNLGMERQFIVNAVLIGALCSVVTVPIAGFLSDVCGRRRFYACGALLVTLFAFPYIYLLETRTPALITLAVVLSLFVHDCLYGPQAAFIAESFPARVRYSGASLGYQGASIIAGGPAPLVSVWLYQQYHSAYAVAVYMAACGLVSAVAAIFLGRSAASRAAADEMAVPVTPAREADRPLAAGGPGAGR